MRKNFRNKFAVFMACASAFGGENLVKANSEVKAKSPQTVAAVRGAITPIKNKGLSKKQKIGIAAAMALPVVAAAVGLTIYGIKKHSDKKDNVPNENKSNNDNLNQKNNNLKIKHNEINNQEILSGIDTEDNDEEENITNSIKMFNALNDVKIDEKGNKEENNKEKELIIKGFEDFVKALNGKSVGELLKLGIVDEFHDNGGKKIEAVNDIEKFHGEIVQGLLDIFSDKSKISDINVEFVPKDSGLNAHYHIDIKFRHDNKEKMIVLSDFVGFERIGVSYFGDKSSQSKIRFMVPYNNLK